MAKATHLIVYLCLLTSWSGVVVLSSAACGLGTTYQAPGDLPGNDDGQVQDLGTIFNDQLPGVSVESGQTTQFDTMSLLGGGISIMDSDSENGTWNMQNRLQFPEDEQ